MWRQGQFWLMACGALLAVLGVLLVVPSVQLMAYAPLGRGALLAFWIMPVLLIGLWFWNAHQRGGLSILLSCLLSCLLVALCVGVFGFRAFYYHLAFEKTLPSQLYQGIPIKVVATVQLDEISDSPYNPAFNQSYRQKARLTDIRLTDNNAQLSSLPKLTNPFYNPKFAQRSPNLNAHSNVNVGEMTVLLSKIPPKLPAHQSPHQSDDPFVGLNDLQAGEQIKMTLSLSPIAFEPKPKGFDAYRYYRSRHIVANAQILAVDWHTKQSQASNLVQKPFVSLEKMRGNFRQYFAEQLNANHNPASAVVLSLLTGDRALIDGETKALYQMAGISHLLAISGTHILFLAVVLAWGIFAVINRTFPQIYFVIARQNLRFLVLALMSLLYAMFTGLEVPALRTVLMLVAVGVVRWWLIECSVWKILAVVGLTLIYFDPYVVWQAGFWLSFVAVGLLMGFDEKLAQSEGLGLVGSLKAKLMTLMKLQTYLFVAMFPISLLLFGQVSWFGLAVNLVAVGLFGLVVVPINLLAGVLFWALPSVSHLLWQVAIAIIGGLSASFGILATWAVNPYLTMPMTVGMIVLGFLAIVAWQSVAMPSRFVVLPMLAMVLVANPALDKQGIIITPLNNSDDNVTQILIKQDKQAWLILNANSPKIPNYDKLADELRMALGKQGVRALTGIVVQTPDETLAKTAGQLSLEMAVQELWWAGNTRQFGKLHARPCVANAKIGTMMTAMTGWRQIADDTMHACALWLNADTPMTVQGETATKYPTANMVINASNDEKLWQVWQLLCRDDKKPVNPVLMGDKNGQLANLFYHN